MPGDEAIFGAEPPVDAGTPRVGARPKFAAGLPAVVKVTKLSLAQMGLLKSLKTLGAVNQVAGFDCPGCAWPEGEVAAERPMAEFCENGAKAVASEATRARATPAFFAAHSIAELAAKSDSWLDKAGRLTHPMVRREGATHYEAIGWDDAFALIAVELKGLASPDGATFYTSGRTSNEAAFVYQLFVRKFGTSNLPDCSNMCHESTGVGLAESIGIGKGTVTIEDFDHADSVWVIGQNPGTNHPRMLSTLARAAKRGCTIVSVNPLREVGMEGFRHPQQVMAMLGATSKIASVFVPVRINGDIAFLKGVMKEMLAEDERTGGGVLDHAFIRERTEGFEAFAADLRAASWEEIVEQSGVTRETIREAAGIATKSERMILCWAMGITQHASGVGNVQTLANFSLLRGQIGRKGAGLCPVRGHSNVQGDRTMGISERMPEWFLSRLGEEFGFTPPREHGLDAVESIRAMHEGRVRVFVGMGGNFLSASPDTRFTAEAMSRCALTVQVSTKLNRGHLVTGTRALILPCLGRTEIDVPRGGDGTQFVTVEDSMGRVHASRGVVEPASDELLSEVAIVCRLARAVLGESDGVEWARFERDYGAIRERVARVLPGFEGYNEKVKEPGGFYLPNGPREGRFTTPSGRARFTVHAIPRWNLKPGELLLMTVRTHDQFNTTVYSDDDRYRGVHGGRRVLFMSSEDMAVRGLTPGEKVDITSHFGEVTREARGYTVVEYDIPPTCVAGYFPELNVLVPVEHVAAGSNQPASKSVVVTVAKSAD